MYIYHINSCQPVVLLGQIIDSAQQVLQYSVRGRRVVLRSHVASQVELNIGELSLGVVAAQNTGSGKGA